MERSKKRTKMTSWEGKLTGLRGVDYAVLRESWNLLRMCVSSEHLRTGSKIILTQRIRGVVCANNLTLFFSFFLITRHNDFNHA